MSGMRCTVCATVVPELCAASVLGPTLTSVSYTAAGLEQELCSSALPVPSFPPLSPSRLRLVGTVHCTETSEGWMPREEARAWASAALCASEQPPPAPPPDPVLFTGAVMV